MIRSMIRPFSATLRGDVNHDFIAIQRIVVALSQLDLPRADSVQIIEHVFQIIEIHQSAFQLVDLHFANIRNPRDAAYQPRNAPSTMRTRRVNKSLRNLITRPVAEHDRSATVQWRPHDFTRLTFSNGST